MAKRGHGDGSIYQRKDKRWVGCLVLEDHTRKYLYGKTRKEVQEKLRTAIAEQQQGILATGPQQTLAAYLHQWLETVHKHTIRIITYQHYESLIRNHVVPTIGHITLQKLTAQHVQSLYNDKINDNLAPRTVAMMHAILHSALDNAVRWSLVSRNVTDLVSIPRVTRRHEVKVLNPTEAKRLIEAADGHRLKFLLILAITTGMRRGELLALRWSDIDFDQHILQVQRTVNRLGKYGFVENPPKTKSGRRRIVLSSVAIDALRGQQKMQDDARALAGDQWEEHGLVFANIYGRFMDPNRVGELFHGLLKKAGLPAMRFHDLRHSAATILLTLGVHPKVVQELLGHSTIVMTMDTYSHLLPSMQQDAMDKMDDALE
ncbi:tyrosine-type recombinase/integrase [Dictyobacter arantiisoli]|uniref:Site-specific integrase n=1 Tax=Dictyobacter arantiisoli TaxID=2014874 RepID=A0A5A5T7H0_9CHLR|nr:site-specific integrase [Dictyobacter arantiisoli]GCF06864.1 site-specific integrase [Dictyobacter arantiisoli]